MERALLERRFFSDSAKKTEILERRKAAAFLKKNKISLVDSMRMRLIYSYEVMGPTKSVSAEDYDKFIVKYGSLYAKWKAKMGPVIDANERVAWVRR